MRVAAGVILIIAAVLNLFAAIGYFSAGAVTAGAGKIGEAMEAEMQKEGKAATPDQQKVLATLKDNKTATAAGGGLMFFGIFLLVTVGTSIAGAVMLFMRKSPMFIYIAAAMALAAEIGGILAILAARGIVAGADRAPVAA